MDVNADGRNRDGCGSVAERNFLHCHLGWLTYVVGGIMRVSEDEKHKKLEEDYAQPKIKDTRR